MQADDARQGWHPCVEYQPAPSRRDFRCQLDREHAGLRIDTFRLRNHGEPLSRAGAMNQERPQPRPW
jgi:hypothetical protein